MGLSFGSIIFLGLAIAVYIFIIIDRICKCFEQCCLHKSLCGVYKQFEPADIINYVNSKKKVENDGC